MKFLNAAWRCSLRSRSTLRNSHHHAAVQTAPQTLVEEETLPFYQSQHFFPVRIGDVYKSRYKVVGKLGYGASSTVWLCRNLKHNKWLPLKISLPYQNLPRYTALKICTASSPTPDPMCREYKAYEHLSNMQSDHPGQDGIRKLYDTFELDSTYGRHQCLLQPPMHMSLLEMMQLHGGPFDPLLLKMILSRLLNTLDFLHSEAKIIHCDLKTDNVMLSIEDPMMPERFEQAEMANPSPQKHFDNSRIIYQSRPFPKPHHDYGVPVLCDFSEARIGELQSSGPWVQPNIYRAPEVIFEMSWGPPVDIWNLACLAWDLVEGRHLFAEIFDGQGQHDAFRHIARMVSLIGPPPPEFVQRSDTTEQCFDMNGNWVADEHATTTSCSLDDIEMYLEGEEQQLFLDFMRSMLKWLPEERKVAKDLLQNPWLQE